MSALRSSGAMVDSTRMSPRTAVKFG
jgi:hypothetical protein